MEFTLPLPLLLPLPLPLHLSIHFIMAVLSGLLIGFYFKKTWLGIIAGICGGFLIDLDHVLEYFLVFGPHFNLAYFIEGRQFLVSDKVRIIFHAFEYVPVLLIMAYLFRRRQAVAVFLMALTFAGFVHLVSDSIINNYPPQMYSIYYRAAKGFRTVELSSSAQYQNNLDLKHELGL
jgi:uncharacterized membrane protein (UPF0136 family)